MKKIAITLSTATLLLGALVGCGGDQQQGAGGLGGANQRGFGYHTTEQDQTAVTGHRVGEGPITDMFTRNDRRGATGFGRDGRQPATGLAGQRGTGLGQGEMGAGYSPRHGSTMGAGTGGAGFGTGYGAGMEEGFGTTGAGRHGANFGTSQGAGQGTGLFGGQRNTGTQTGLGMHGQGTMLGGGQHSGTGFGFETRDHDIRTPGIVGDDRPGYVDERGILKPRPTTIGGLGQAGRTNMGKDHAQGLGTGRTEMKSTNFSYPEGYDTTTVNRINTGLVGVDNVTDSRVVVHGDKVIVAVEANGGDTQAVEQNVRRAVGNMAGDKEIIVITDRDQYNQIRTADDRLRAGEPFEEIGTTINDMFHDFGRALRPMRR